MKFTAYAIIATALVAVAGCTTDDYVGRPQQKNRMIDDRPQYDRNGNPNFDARGRYIGCHGLGCKVDDPDDGDQSIDDRPQYDKQGNPNFDTQGNYQGCHGLGCDVDTPADDSSDDDDSN
ncbi:YgdI/YgdR family lipoprotein [Mesorhizobium sp. dw_380]|uniref:YgdI/YgdR family lipoprotein n=1 Tax=Mesorhizobium sp. dw_380 TaxID=2812001 RepID=UPI001BDF4CDE|nr:YgdI/YgdR family lipoprotein [Mesorhizobium sp. dw_380]